MMLSDTLKVAIENITTTVAIPGTVQVALIQNQKTLMDNPWFIAILTGGFTIGGVLLGQYLQRRTMEDIYNQQGYLNRDKELFVMRMNAYREMAAALSEAYHVSLFKADGTKTKPFPSAYISYDYLKQWMNGVTKLVDRNLLIIDQTTYQRFDGFNNMILNHLKEVETNKNKKAWPLITREIGRRECESIQNLEAEIITDCRNFIKAKYNVELETIR